MQETVMTNKLYDYNGNSFIKKYQNLFLVLLVLMIGMIIYQVVERNAIRKEPPIHSIFYQPLLKDQMDWDATFKKLEEAEIESLILQWSKFGVVDFLKEEAWLKEILSKADKYHLKVVVGLYGDNNYFKTLENRDTNVEIYLEKLMVQNIIQAKKIYHIAKAYDSFEGYYIYDEIDDTNFIEEQRQHYLKNYLQTMAGLIKSISGHQLYISGYFSKNISAEKYATMLSNVTAENYTLLLQSGIGAGLVDANSSSRYMERFKNEFKGEFIPIVEGFQSKNSKIEAIDFSKLEHQINLIQQSAQSQELSLFSLRYFVDERLFKSYIAAYCSPKE